MGLRVSDAWRGESLVREVFGAPAQPKPVIVDLPRCDLMDRRRALVSGAYKLIAFGDDYSYELYNVARDFKEEEELSKREPDKLQQMKALYRELSERIPNLPVVGNAPLKGARPGQRW
jgi:arylsulfatase A-like enzyme